MTEVTHDFLHMFAIANRPTLHRMKTLRKIVTLPISLLYVALIVWDRHRPRFAPLMRF